MSEVSTDIRILLQGCPTVSAYSLNRSVTTAEYNKALGTFRWNFCHCGCRYWRTSAFIYPSLSKIGDKLAIHASLLRRHVVPYAYKFSRDVYFANAPHLTIFTILISRMTGCSRMLVPYACTFLHLYYRDRLLIHEICENKVP